MKILNQEFGGTWALYHGDCVEVLKGLPDNCVHYICFSPPFLSLYFYSSDAADMGNSKNKTEFYQHYEFLSKELYRVLMPGRCMSVHSMIMPTSKQNDGYIGLTDFPGEIRKIHMTDGFIFASEVVIRKCPVVAVTRTKALGLLHKQLVKDSSMSRQAIPDYLTTFRKPGVNEEPIAGLLDEYVGIPSGEPEWEDNQTKNSIKIWQKYAEPTWIDIESKFKKILPTLNPEQAELFFQIMERQCTEVEIWEDIVQGNTLNRKLAREESDTRHIVPLQLDVIHRALQLWTNSGDICLDPFSGIGSCGYEAIKMNRRYVGIELKESYWKVSVDNLTKVESEFESK